MIVSEGRRCEFEGFSLFTHKPLPANLPRCRVLRWNIDYCIDFVQEPPPSVSPTSPIRSQSSLAFVPKGVHGG